MEIQRTMRIRLCPDRERSALLARTIEAYTASFNAVAAYGWESGLANGTELHKATYYEHRATYGLPAQLTCAARVKATEALKSARALIAKTKREVEGLTCRVEKAQPEKVEAVEKRLAKASKRLSKLETSCPRSAFCPVRYDQRSYSVWFDRLEVTLLTVEGRVKLPFRIPAYYAEYASWKPSSADLVRDRQGRWWLHIVMTTEIEQLPETDEVVGIDLGVNVPAADSKGNFYGSDHWKVVEQRIFEHRCRLQAKGTRSATRRLQTVSGRQRRFRKDCDHVLSKQIVRSVQPGGTLAFEDLTDIRFRAEQRKAQRRRFHGWSFAQLQAFVAYKAAVLGVRIAYVDPRYTSQTCSCCSHLSRCNRPSRPVFSCKQCGFEAHADTNAAINIRAKHLFQRAAVNRPIAASRFAEPAASFAL